MKVKLKPYVLETLKKCNGTYTFRLDDEKIITYFKEFVKYEYFEVICEKADYYKISLPRNINYQYFLHKDHVVQADLYGLDDKVFEWEE